MFNFVRKIKVVSLITLCVLPSYSMDTNQVHNAIHSYKVSLPNLHLEVYDNDSIGKEIASYLLKFRHSGHEMEGQTMLEEKIVSLCQSKDPIPMILLGFPFKSTNREIKCIGPEVDIAEYLGLTTLQHMADQIQKIYTPGIKITIVSDGLAYQTVIDETVQNILQYQKGVQKLIEEHFPALSFVGFKINDSIDSPDTLIAQVRQVDVAETRESEETKKDLRAFVSTDYSTKTWDNTFQNLAEEACKDITFTVPSRIKKIDEYIKKRKSSTINEKKNQLRKEKIDETVEQLSIGSIRFGTFVKSNFPNYSNYIRLSVHPHANVSEKLGIALVYGEKGTPWHNAVRLEGNTFRYLNDKSSNRVSKIDISKVQTYLLGNMELKYVSN